MEPNTPLTIKEAALLTGKHEDTIRAAMRRPRRGGPLGYTRREDGAYLTTPDDLVRYGYRLTGDTSTTKGPTEPTEAARTVVEATEILLVQELRARVEALETDLREERAARERDAVRAHETLQAVTRALEAGSPPQGRKRWWRHS
jgi:hypothetical protein